MAKWQEREHILNRFPSSACTMYLCGAQNQRGSARLYVYTTSMLLERTRLFFLGGSFEFKRFKAISQEGGASDCRPSNTDRPTTLLLLLALVVLDPFSSLLAFFPRFGCDLLQTFKRTMPPCPEKAVSFSAKNFEQHEKWCKRPSCSQYVSSCLVSSWHVLLESRRLSCDNNFYDAHWLSGDRWRYYGQRHGNNPTTRIREGLS